MNMAATWHLPIIYCLVNNGYAISTTVKEAHPQHKLATWADGYEVTNFTIDGNNIEEVVETTEKAAKLCREGKGPVLIEYVTYRWQGHFAGDPAAYRPDEEVEDWKENKDPVKLTRALLIDREKVAEDDLKKIEDEVEADVQDMLKFSLESPVPPISYATEYTYADREVEDR